MKNEVRSNSCRYPKHNKLVNNFMWLYVVVRSPYFHLKIANYDDLLRRGGILYFCEEWGKNRKVHFIIIYSQFTPNSLLDFSTDINKYEQKIFHRSILINMVKPGTRISDDIKIANECSWSFMTLFVRMFMCPKTVKSSWILN